MFTFAFDTHSNSSCDNQLVRRIASMVAASMVAASKAGSSESLHRSHLDSAFQASDNCSFDKPTGFEPWCSGLLHQEVRYLDSSGSSIFPLAVVAEVDNYNSSFVPTWFLFP